MIHSVESIRDYMLVYYTGLFCIVWYDWLVLLVQEYQRIWMSNWSLVKFLYLGNRYSMLALTVVIWTGFGLHKETSQCTPIFAFQNMLPLLVYLFSGFILILRCYALYGKSKAVAGVLLALHLFHIGISGYTIAQVKTLDFDGPGPCIPKDTKIYHAFYVCFSALVFDLVASVLSVYKAYSYKKQHCKAAVPSLVIDNIIRNGSLYIVGMVLAAFGNMAFRFLSARNFATPMDGYAGGNLCVVINSILSARLCLSLKVDDQFSTVQMDKRSSTYPSKNGTRSHASSGSHTMTGSVSLGKEAFASFPSASSDGVALQRTESDDYNKPSEVAVTIYTETRIDAPSISEKSKDWEGSNEDLEMQTVDNKKTVV